MLPANRLDWPGDELESFEERAGICEFEAGLSEAAATQTAEAAVRSAHLRSWLLDHGLPTAQ